MSPIPIPIGTFDAWRTVETTDETDDFLFGGWTSSCTSEDFSFRTNDDEYTVSLENNRLSTITSSLFNSRCDYKEAVLIEPNKTDRSTYICGADFDEGTWFAEDIRLDPQGTFHISLNVYNETRDCEYTIRAVGFSGE